MMGEQGKTEEGGGGGAGGKELAMTSHFSVNQNPSLRNETISKYHAYPPPLAIYEDIVSSPKLFMATLEKLHAVMGTKFMIPIIGGKELDLHRLFVEVTSRGGLEKIIRERRWKEVTAVFSFPSTATNASFVLRKYYLSLLHHYEQIYFFKAQGWTPVSDASQSPSITPVPSHGLVEAVLPSPESQPADGHQQQRISSAEIFPGVTTSSSAASPVIGVIDGKFESGYLVTVTIGNEKLKGVLYEAPQTPARQVPQYFSVVTNNAAETTPAGPIVHRRRRRKKSEIKKRDPAHPKPNRSGYNFFFAEQHARLKPLHPGKDREISRMIGELWTKLKENEKSVYQEKAIKDKERYKVEMEDYRERLKMGQIISDAVPIQQRFPQIVVAAAAAAADEDMAEAEVKEAEMEGGESPQSPENESTSGKTDSEDEKTGEKDFEMEIETTTTTMYPEVGVVGIGVVGVEGSGGGGECSNVPMSVGMETITTAAAVTMMEEVEARKRVEEVVVGVVNEDSLENVMGKGE